MTTNEELLDIGHRLIERYADSCTLTQQEIEDMFINDIKELYKGYVSMDYVTEYYMAKTSTVWCPQCECWHSATRVPNEMFSVSQKMISKEEAYELAKEVYWKSTEMTFDHDLAVAFNITKEDK